MREVGKNQGLRRILRRIGFVLAGLLTIVVLLYICFFIFIDRALNNMDASAKQKSVTSKDGAIIAYEQTGAGPVVVLVAGALADRSGARRLAKNLAAHFTVINYDRRGRGQSTDAQPHAVEREVEDIEALIDANGGSACVFGTSSGAALALEAGSHLGGKVKKLFLHEPPFIVDDSRPPMPEDLSKQINDLVLTGRRDDAVKLFFGKGMGIPDFAVTMMRWLMPGWSKMRGMAHTVPYDLAVLAGTQTGKPLSAKRWTSTIAPTLFAVGSKSEPFFHTSAKAVAGMFPNAQYRSLEGLDHSAVLMAPQAMAAEIERFFLEQK